MGFAGGFIAGGFGVGAGIIINIALTHLDVFPPVASGTSMFTTMQGAISSTIIVIIYGKLNLAYAGVIVLM
jgi:uncharacterized membrane protein YfcA